MNYSIKPIFKKTIIFNKGFSLLEVMIAMVIFAVGILGLAGMQIVALENSNESSSRNQAIILAYSMSDRMMANRQAQDGYKVAYNAAVQANSNCENANCSSAQIVAYDLGQWKKNINQQLLSGSGAIDGSFLNNYTITVRWDEDRSGATGTNCPPQGVNDLRCFELLVRLWN